MYPRWCNTLSYTPKGAPCWVLGDLHDLCTPLGLLTNAQARRMRYLPRFDDRPRASTFDLVFVCNHST